MVVPIDVTVALQRVSDRAGSWKGMLWCARRGFEFEELIQVKPGQGTPLSRAGPGSGQGSRFLPESLRKAFHRGIVILWEDRQIVRGLVLPTDCSPFKAGFPRCNGRTD